MDVILVLYLIVPVLMLVVGGTIGRTQERRHLQYLDRREADLASVVVTDLRSTPSGVDAHHAVLVIGEVVVGTDYFKRFAAGLRKLVGGEVRSFSNTLARARREARIRMIDDARARGFDLVINVRFVTSTVISGASEIVCYGTAIRTRP